MVPEPNERWGAQICEKRQRVWPGTFNGQYETAKAIAAFKLGGRDTVTELKPRLEVGHLESRSLSVDSKGNIVDMLISKHTYEEERGYSKNNDRPLCSETDQEEEVQNCEGRPKNYNPGGGEDDKKASSWPREGLFEKAMTPSDVGKLNRLVIPKQHAEKYLPMDTEEKEKGLFLNFEDSSGKKWRFRYSYWNSSQSYVLTKGWSRFVKEMKLDTGDIVSFHRATHQDPNLQRLFISCRRKPCSAAQPPGLPDSIIRSLQLSSPAINNIAGSHGQQLVTSGALIGPQWTPLSWPASNVIGSPGAPETGTLQTNAKPMDVLTSLHFITSDDKPGKRKGIHDSGFPFSIQRSSNTTECGRYAVDTKSWLKAPPLRAMHLKAPGSFPDDLSAATRFDHSTSASTSKKVVRLFGVNLEFGEFNGNYKDELLLI